MATSGKKSVSSGAGFSNPQGRRALEFSPVDKPGFWDFRPPLSGGTEGGPGGYHNDGDFWDFRPPLSGGNEGGTERFQRRGFF